MRRRSGPILLVAILTILGTIGWLVQPESQGGHEPSDAPATPTSATVTESVSATGVAAFDLDGDGKLGPAEVKAAVISHAATFEFAPGYEFDVVHYSLDIDRILDTDWRTFSFAYPETVIVPAQTCSWIQYWLDMTDEGEIDAAADALEVVGDLGRDDALGDLAEPVASMVAAAEAGDAELVQKIFTGANCHLTYFISDSIGPLGRWIDLRARF